MMVGPRNSIVAALLDESPAWNIGEPIPDSWLTDFSPWAVAPYRMTWDAIRDDWPELWVDRIHDHVGGQDGSEIGA